MIACVYCGGQHARPADVKRCWSAGRSDAPPGPARAPVVAPAVAPVDVVVRRGPAALGRNVAIAPGASPPDEWADAPRLTIDEATIADPEAAIDRLRAGGLAIEVAPGVLEPEPLVAQSEARPPFEVGPSHRFAVDELRHLVWSNTIDVRGEPRWAAAEGAVALGASVATDGVGDVVLPDGARAWLDGGPVRFVEPIDGVVVLPAVSVEHGSLVPPDTNATDADLAPDQLAAVTHPTATARIIAPAGSGKTRVLTERARHLIRRWRIPPSAVTLVAFNKRAQEEMRDRTSDLTGLQVRTLNSIALAVANGTPPFAAQPATWRTIDEPAVRQILQRFVSTRRRRNTDPIAPWIDALGAVRLGLAGPSVVEPRYGGDVDGLADVFPQYVAALERDGAVDFDGQIDRAVRVLLTDPAARAAAQRSCRVLLVDEFQDLAPAHLLLIRLLAGPGSGVFAVGDDDQTIYGYQGADPGWLIDFERWFPGAGDHPLEVNYRCPAGIVEVADRLLRHNRRRVDKTIRAHGTTTGGWTALVDRTDPVDATVATVRGAISAGAAAADVAVLTRVNATLAPVQLGLVAAGVPIHGGVGTDFVERTAVRAALAWLRLAAGRRFDPSDVHEALRRPSRSLHPRIGDWVGEQVDVDGLRRLAERLTNERDAARVGELADDVEKLTRLLASSHELAPVLDELIDGIGLGGSVATLDDHRRGMNRASQGDDLVALRQLAALYDAASPGAPFDRWMRDVLAASRDPNGVTLATVHRVKGQEWQHVVVHLADADQFPHRLADDPEEERRLFHVAITRARESATIVAGERPSPFVAELTTEPPDELPETPPARRPATAPVRSATGRPDHPLLDRERVIAVPGLVLVDQGHEWVITSLEPEAAVAERGDATRRFPIGAKVETAGRQRGALGPRPGEVAEASARLFDRLRSFRDRARNGKPAYTVFDDKTLAAIASALPADLDELARVKGVGPAKLEQYGDDVLELVADAVD